MLSLFQSHGFGGKLRQTLRMVNERGVPLLLGVILLTAAALKTHQLATSPTTEDTLFTSRWFLIGLVEFELAVGLWLLSSAYPKQARLAALTAFAGFCSISLYQALTGETSCGCFGKVSVNPWYTSVFDVATVVLIWRWHPRGTSEHLRMDGWMDGWIQNIRSHASRLVAFGMLFLSAGIPAAIAMISYRPAMLSAQGEIIGDSPTVVLEPETWIGRQFPLLKHIEIDEDLSTGEWLVVFYHRDCPKCREAIREYELFARSERENRRKCQVALIEVPEKRSAPARAGWARMACVQGRLSDACEWLIHTPIVVRVQDGRTLAIVNKPSEMLASRSTSSGG